MNSTSLSLLERVRNPADQDAWNRFVHLYSPLIFDWCRRSGLQAAEAEDLTQDVFATLFQKLPEFTYDRQKSFRGWLRTVTLNHWHDRRRRIGTRPLPGVGQPIEALESPSGISALEEAEYRQHLLSRALQIMRSDFEPATWQAFWAHGVEGQPAAAVAKEMGLSLTAVYGAKFRVLSRLRQELLGLLD